MIFNRFLVSVLLLFSFSVKAAVKIKDIEGSVPEVSMKELLSMPEKNRLSVASVQKKPNLYFDLLKLAFNKEESFQFRWKALTLAASLRGAPAAEEIQKACALPEWYMKNACLVALQKIDLKKAEAFSKKLISDKALVVRSAAVRVLAAKLNEENRSLLWDELEKPYNFRVKQSLWVRSEIMEVLSKAPTLQEKNLFAKSLRDKDSRLHLYAIHGLERISKKVLGSSNSSLAAKRELWLKAVK